MKKELEITLESLEGFSKPQIKLEQYVTPPVLAAEIVVNANLIGDLRTESTLVIDLGCGTGMLSIAASLIGVRTIGLDSDVTALKVARKNALKVGTSDYVEFIACRIENNPLNFKNEIETPEFKKLERTNSNNTGKDTWSYIQKNRVVIMNPPFGIQKKHADRPFIDTAMKISNVIYSIHAAGSEMYIEKVCGERGFKITHIWKYKIPLKRSYKFHEKDFKYIAVEVFRLVKENSRS